MTGSVFGGVHNFFHSGTWEAIKTLLILFVLLLWGATTFWVWKDARRRIAEPALVWISTLVGAIPPFLGPLVYMLFRPPEYLADVRERELEIQAIERRLNEHDEQCGVCGSTVQPDFLVCPVCTTKLREACASCTKPLEASWQICPYCQTPVGSDAVPLTSKRRPRRTTTQTPPSG